jgi:hypothetical protein
MRLATLTGLQVEAMAVGPTADDFAAEIQVQRADGITKAERKLIKRGEAVPLVHALVAQRETARSLGAGLRYVLDGEVGSGGTQHFFAGSISKWLIVTDILVCHGDDTFWISFATADSAHDALWNDFITMMATLIWR